MPVHLVERRGRPKTVRSATNKARNAYRGRRERFVGAVRMSSQVENMFPSRTFLPLVV